MTVSQPQALSPKFHTVIVDKETNQYSFSTARKTCDKTNNNKGKYITLKQC